MGGRIVSYSKEKREYIVGTIKEGLFYDTLIGNYDYPNIIKVDRENETVERDRLSEEAKNSLGSVLTVFRVDQWGEEIERLLENGCVESVADNEEEAIIADLIGKAFVMVEDKVDNLDAWEMQELVGGLLEAMDYNVSISPKGPDGGVDLSI